MFTSATPTMRNGQRAIAYDGDIIIRYQIGGSRAWRNNNPGNLKYSTWDVARQKGSIGRDFEGFEIFPSYNTGYAALKDVVTVTYASKTIEQLMNIYAPPSENDTEAYIEEICRSAGVARTAVVSSLSAGQISTVLETIKRVEGYTFGQVEDYRKPVSAAVS